MSNKRDGRWVETTVQDAYGILLVTESFEAEFDTPQGWKPYAFISREPYGFNITMFGYKRQDAEFALGDTIPVGNLAFLPDDKARIRTKT